jgi:hypothetical protein
MRWRRRGANSKTHPEVREREKVEIDEQLHRADKKDGQGRGDGAKRGRNTETQRREGGL